MMMMLMMMLMMMMLMMIFLFKYHWWFQLHLNSNIPKIQLCFTPCPHTILPSWFPFKGLLQPPATFQTNKGRTKSNLCNHQRNSLNAEMAFGINFLGFLPSKHIWYHHLELISTTKTLSKGTSRKISLALRDWRVAASRCWYQRMASASRSHRRTKTGVPGAWQKIWEWLGGASETTQLNGCCWWFEI